MAKKQLLFARVALGAVLLCAILAATAAAWPRVSAIRFEGNRVTRESVMLRELRIAPGDPADPAVIEAGRQAILDLGLFREVTAEQQPADGGVVLVIRVREKFYLLPIPRGDLNSDEDVVYGAQLRWNNVFGLNHTLDTSVERGEFPNDTQREKEDNARIEYRVPYLGASDYGLLTRFDYLDRVNPGTDGRFDETFRRFELQVRRDLRTERPRRGWTLGTGIFYEDQATDGEFAPPSDGHSTALLGVPGYDDLRFNVYSETGQRFGTRIEAAIDGVASDFGYTRTTAAWFGSRAIGETPHQTLHLLAAAGYVSDGPRSRNNFSLGGSGRLRGYESDYVEGDRFGYVAVEYLRPLRWKWLRLLVTAELGAADDDIQGRSDGSPYASIGIGVRIRFPQLVNVEVEAGIALPLIDGDGPRFFAGGN